MLPPQTAKTDEPTGLSNRQTTQLHAPFLVSYSNPRHPVSHKNCLSPTSSLNLMLRIPVSKWKKCQLTNGLAERHKQAKMDSANPRTTWYGHHSHPHWPSSHSKGPRKHHTSTTLLVTQHGSSMGAVFEMQLACEQFQSHKVATPLLQHWDDKYDLSSSGHYWRLEETRTQSQKKQEPWLKETLPDHITSLRPLWAANICTFDTCTEKQKTRSQLSITLRCM